MPTLEFESRFENNAVVVLDALGTSDLQTARRLEEGLADLKIADGSQYCRIIKTPTKEAFLAALDTINAQCQEGMRPVIHIEGHGNILYGLAVGDGQGFVSWQELEAHLLKINKVTRNNLGVVIASCFGLYAISPLRIYNPCPYYFLIGPDAELPSGYIDDQMKLFYRSLCREGSLVAAMQTIEDRFKQFHAEQFFYGVFAGYIRRGGMGKGAAERVERLVSGGIAGGLPRNRETLRNLRRMAKSFVKPSREVFERRAKQFLHGRNSVSYDQLLAFVTNLRVTPDVFIKSSGTSVES